MHGVLHILVAMLLLTFASCEKDDDYRAPDTPDTSYDFSFTYEDGTRGDVYIIQEHTKGSNGFPVVIMGDGYSQTDIDNGEYKEAVSNAIKAMTMQKPMKDLVEYLDIYSVVTVSEESGIDYNKHNTAFKTYLESKDNTNVLGDTTKIRAFTYGSLRKDLNRMHNALTIMLLNSADYAGVTLMVLDTTVVDTIPQGWSLSYIPDKAMLKGRNIFNELVMHEAVGHGIGKLADEYWYNEPLQKQKEDTVFYKQSRKFGWLTNIKYFDNVETGSWDPKYIYKANNTGEYYIQRCIDAEDDILVPFANDSRYAGEEHKWIQGGYTFITLTNTWCGKQYEYTDEKGIKKIVEPNKCMAYFYRSSKASMMGDVSDTDLEFNIISRLAIYKRINRVANGTGWKYDYETFVKFDKGESTTKSVNTFKMPSKTKQGIISESEKQLTRPKIILE